MSVVIEFYFFDGVVGEVFYGEKNVWFVYE